MLPYLALAIIFVAIISVMISGSSVFALTDSQRYSSGYSHGCSDGKKGSHSYLSKSGGATSHTSIFMKGYNIGYSDCSAGTQNWGNICNTIEWGLMNGCSTYVKSDGALTTEGKRAKDCVSNGGLLAGAGVLAGLPPGWIIGILKPLSDSTNCGGIVNWQVLETAANANDFLRILGIG